ncbi:MAG TPA: hypothetical protein VNW54_06740 [Granulicella sp.]|jgi:hypothetical protein|nr:hypothetical protein [Granulicella sp.]
MSISGISNTTGSQYNFSNMTNQQEIAAASNLANQGVITGDQFAVLAGEAVSYVPSAGVQAGAANDPLNSTTNQNFVQMLQNNIAQLQNAAGSDPAMQKSLATEASLMNVLNQYGTSGSTLSNGTIMNQQA